MYNTEQIWVLVRRAVNFGVNRWGKKEVMAIQLGAYWLEGYMDALQLPDEDRNVLRQTINNYKFDD